MWFIRVKADHYPAGGEGDRAGSQARSHASRHHGHARAGSELYRLAHLARWFAQNDHIRAPLRKSAIVAVNREVLFGEKDAILPDDPDQAVDKLTVHWRSHKLPPAA